MFICSSGEAFLTHKSSDLNSFSTDCTITAHCTRVTWQLQCTATTTKWLSKQLTELTVLFVFYLLQLKHVSTNLIFSTRKKIKHAVYHHIIFI